MFEIGEDTMPWEHPTILPGHKVRVWLYNPGTVRIREMTIWTTGTFLSVVVLFMSLRGREKRS